MSDKDKRVRFFFTNTVPLLGYLSLIAVLSHTEGAAFGIPVYHDKCIHCLEYLPVGFLLLRWLSNRSRKRSQRGKAMVATLVLGVLYGAADEVHQSFIPGRSAELLDVAADGVGVLIGCLGYALWMSRDRNWNNNLEIKI